MTEPSNPIETVSEMRLDEETEKLIFAVWRRSPESKFAIVALRSRIRHLVEEARKKGQDQILAHYALPEIPKSSPGLNPSNSSYSENRRHGV